MTKHVTTIAEMRSMSQNDLRKEIRDVRGEVDKQRLAVGSRTEKDTATFARGKKQVARMLTVLRQIESDATLKRKAKSSKISTLSA